MSNKRVVLVKQLIPGKLGETIGRFKVSMKCAAQRNLQRNLKKSRFLFSNFIDVLTGNKTIIPPDWMLEELFIGGGGFERVGQEYLSLLKNPGGLQANDSVLDLGCGMGRMAVSLAGYLSAKGSYEGFDIQPEAIQWCKRKISAKYPNFHFRLGDVYNQAYNPTGKFKAHEYQLPYPQGSFDFVFLASVFTHMLPQDVEHYLQEIARVLKKGKRCAISFFLLNLESTRLLTSHTTDFQFQARYEKYGVVNTQVHEIGVCYDENYILELFDKNGLKRIGPIHYGSWCGRQKFLSFQDLVVASKE